MFNRWFRQVLIMLSVGATDNILNYFKWLDCVYFILLNIIVYEFISPPPSPPQISCIKCKNSFCMCSSYTQILLTVVVVICYNNRAHVTFWNSTEMTNLFTCTSQKSNTVYINIITHQTFKLQIVQHMKLKEYTGWWNVTFLH